MGNLTKPTLTQQHLAELIEHEKDHIAGRRPIRTFLEVNPERALHILEQAHIDIQELRARIEALEKERDAAPIRLTEARWQAMSFVCDRESVVIDSRWAETRRAVRRRRECLSCGHRFTTYEMEGIRDVVPTKRRLPKLMTAYNGLRLARTNMNSALRKISEAMETIET